MFTGLIAELGAVERLAEENDSCRLTVRAQKIMPGVKIGDSIAVNGVCLTVVHLQGGRFTADVMPETVRRTTLHQLHPGDRVNLEKALRPEDGLNGHIVQGHVEGIGKILGIQSDGNALLYRIEAPAELLKYIVEKGSIAVDGISLTVTGTDEEEFRVSLIPHTAKMTTLGYKTVGAPVNLETDIIARYVEKMMAPKDSERKRSEERRARVSGEAQDHETELTEEFLSRHGF